MTPDQKALTAARVGMAAAVLFVVGCVTLMAAGCWGTSTVDSAVAEFIEATNADGAKVTRSRITGPSARVTDLDKFKMPSVSAGPDGADAGRSSVTAFFTDPGKAWLWIIGGVCIAGGAVAGYFLGWQVGVLIAAGGACLLATAMYPWLLLVAALLAIVAGCYIGYKAYKGQNATTTVNSFVTGVEALPDKTAATVKKTIGAAAGKNKPVVDKTVDKAKADNAAAIEAVKVAKEAEA